MGPVPLKLEGTPSALGGLPVVRGNLCHGRLRVHAAASRRNLLPCNTSGAMPGSACNPRISSSAITWSPAGTSAWIEQSSHAVAPRTKTAPSALAPQSTSVARR